MNSVVRTYYHFGSFQLDVAARLLLRDGEIVPLTPKIYETLLLLLRHRGKLVERAQLIQAVWRDDYVEEGNISSTIYLLRKALGDSRNGQPYIATVSRQGYRFVAPVRELCVAEPPIPVPGVDVLAVLPFQSLNVNDLDEGLSLGLADAVITHLSNCRKLMVRPTSVMRKYINTELDPVTIGQEVGATLIVEGNFQRSGEYIRVTAQLVSAVDNTPLWAATYDEQFTDLFTVEDAISKNISQDLIFELIDKPVTAQSWASSESVDLPPLRFSLPTNPSLPSYSRDI